jgi:hypothetical protein
MRGRRGGLRKSLVSSALAASLLAVLGGSARAAAPGFRKDPYLQALGSDRVLVRFELAEPGRASVVVTGPGDGAPQTFDASEPSAFHSVGVHGLTPATTYHYEVHAGSAVESGQFTTAPIDARPFSFVVYGDSRSDPSTHAAIADALLKAPGDFLVGTGDLTARGDDPEEWSSFFSIECKLIADRCLFSAIGNHELVGSEGGGAPSFLRYFATGLTSGEPRLFDTFRWGDTRFFVLNAMDDFSGTEREWLERALDKADAEPGLEHRFVVAHIGPYSSGPHGNNQRMHAAGIPDLLRKHHVDLVFSGHDHIYERGEADGLKYIVSGGAGAPLYPIRHVLPTTGKIEAAHHWVEVAVDGARVRTRAVRLDGTVIETCSYELGAPWSCASPASPKPAPGTATPTASNGGSKCGCELPGRAAGDGRTSIPLEAIAAGAVAWAWARRRRGG